MISIEIKLYLPKDINYSVSTYIIERNNEKTDGAVNRDEEINR